MVTSAKQYLKDAPHIPSAVAQAHTLRGYADFFVL
jgi:hypothetical protein